MNPATIASPNAAPAARAVPSLPRDAQPAAPLRSAIRLATFNGWMTAVFALASLPGAASGPASFAVGVGLGAVACNELWGRNRLRRGEPRALRLLAWNQLGFLALIVAYSLWTLSAWLHGESVLRAALAVHPEVRSLDLSSDDIECLHRTLAIVLWSAVMAIACAVQGLCALYYYGRFRKVSADTIHRARAGRPSCRPAQNAAC